MSKMAEKRMNKVINLVKLMVQKGINTYDREEDFETFFHNELFEEVRREAEAIAYPRKKNSDMPKKPKNAWIFFCQEERERLKKSGKKFSPVEMTHALSSEWTKLTEKDKARLAKFVQEDKERYVAEVMALPEEKRPPAFRKKDKKTKVTGYTLFCKENKCEYPGEKWVDVRKKLNESWKEIDAEEKKEYAERAKKINEGEVDEEISPVREPTPPPSPPPPSPSPPTPSPPKKKAPAKKKARSDTEDEEVPKKVVKKKALADSDAEDEDEDRPKTPEKAKPRIVPDAPKKKVPTKKKARNDDSESD